MSDQTTTLPIPPDVFWAIAGIGGLALLTLVIFGAMIPAGSNSVAPLERLKDRLGLASLNSGLFLIVLTFWGALFLTLTVGLIWLIWDLIWMVLTVNRAMVWTLPWLPVPEDTAKILGFSIARIAGLTATLGAVVALPFTLIKVRMTGEQTRTAQEGLITDRINKAVEGLGAERTEKFYGEADDQGRYHQLERTAPNLEVRIGAIYALERIAQDSDRDHVQVMEILCAYIRGNAPRKDDFKFPDDWPTSPASIINNKMYRDYNTRKNQYIATQIRNWCDENLSPPRADIQTALTVIGRRSEHQIYLEEGFYDHNREWHGFRLDLRNTCLQGADLSKGKFRNARLSGSQLQGTKFCETNLQRADFSRAELQAANFVRANLQGATLQYCQADGAIANDAHLELDAVSNSTTSLNDSVWRWSAFQGANLSCSFICKTNLHASRLEGARLASCAIHYSDFSEAHLERCVFSNSFITSPNIQDTIFSTGTIFSGANFDTLAHILQVSR